MTFLNLFDAFVQGSRCSSWRQINATRHQMLKTSIEGRIPFEPEAFTALYKKYGGDYWLGSDPSSWYTMSIEAGNTTATKAWETHFGVRPYIFFGRRLSTGREFVWDGCAVRVTSIDQERIIACGKTDQEAHRYRITVADLKAREAEIKDRLAEWNATLVEMRKTELADIDAIQITKVRERVGSVLLDAGPIVFEPQRGFCSKGPGGNHAYLYRESDIQIWLDHRAGAVARLKRQYAAEKVQWEMERLAA